jgi:hypothetical protein
MSEAPQPRKDLAKLVVDGVVGHGDSRFPGMHIRKTPARLNYSTAIDGIRTGEGRHTTHEP